MRLPSIARLCTYERVNKLATVKQRKLLVGSTWKCVYLVTDAIEMKYRFLGRCDGRMATMYLAFGQQLGCKLIAKGTYSERG